MFGVCARLRGCLTGLHGPGRPPLSGFSQGSVPGFRVCVTFGIPGNNRRGMPKSRVTTSPPTERRICIGLGLDLARTCKHVVVPPQLHCFNQLLINAADPLRKIALQVVPLTVPSFVFLRFPCSNLPKNMVPLTDFEFKSMSVFRFQYYRYHLSPPVPPGLTKQESMQLRCLIFPASGAGLSGPSSALLKFRGTHFFPETGVFLLDYVA
jgi:hypothetical protein